MSGHGTCKYRWEYDEKCGMSVSKESIFFCLYILYIASSSNMAKIAWVVQGTVECTFSSPRIPSHSCLFCYLFVTLVLKGRVRHFKKWMLRPFNPLTAGAAYIRVFIFLLPHFKYVKDKIWHQSARFENSWPPFCKIWIIFTHLKLWIATARHNFKWVKIQIE